MIQKLVNQYEKTEEEILKEIEKLPSYGTDCTCNNQEEFVYVFHGNFLEIIRVCTNCGGSIWDR